MMCSNRIRLSQWVKKEENNYIYSIELQYDGFFFSSWLNGLVWFDYTWLCFMFFVLVFLWLLYSWAFKGAQPIRCRPLTGQKESLKCWMPLNLGCATWGLKLLHSCLATFTLLFVDCEKQPHTGNQEHHLFTAPVCIVSVTPCSASAAVMIS